MMFDTDLLICVFRGNKKAARLVEATEPRCLSVISYLELLQGARNTHESKTIKRFLSDFGFQMLPLSENIGHRASIYMEEYGLKVAMGVADTLVAATAVEAQLTLCTGNRKHYKPIVELDLKVFRP